MKISTSKLAISAAMTIGLAFTAPGCDDAADMNIGDSDSTEFRQGSRSKEATLSSFETCDSLQEYVVDRYTDFVVDQNSYYRYGGPVFEDDFASDPSAPEAGDQDGGSNGEEPGDFTDTNVQELGVDEADMVKTNGNYIYFVQGSVLRVMKSFPPEDTGLIAELTVPGYSSELYLDGDDLIVLSHEYMSPYYPVFEPDAPCYDRPEVGEAADDEFARPPTDGCQPEDAWGPLGYGPRTHVNTYDVSNPEDPQLRSSVELQGNLIDSRRVDDSVYLVTQRDIAWDYDLMRNLELSDDMMERMQSAGQIEDEVERATALDAIKRDLRPVIAEQFEESDFVDRLKTRYTVGDGDAQTLVDCADMMRPSIDSESMSLLNVVAFSVDEPEGLDGVALVSSGWHVYASADSLYVARDSRGWDWWSTEQPEAMTHIHRFLLSDANVSYAASGSVDGFVKDRYSFSEHRGYLRVATTDEQVFWWGGPVAVDFVEPAPTEEPVSSDGGATGSDGGEADDGEPVDPEMTTSPKQNVTEPEPVQANNLFVLEESGDDLEVVGELRGYGANERIYSVRYMGDRAYIVTFRQTDPLFTIDLSEPTAPAITGELKITGFSNYLHPISDDHLIGIGREADETGRVTGFQVQLFDVSDDENPVRTSQYLLDFGNGWASSAAEHDPHAFVWYARRNLLAIPLTVENWSNEEYSSFSGLALFHITPEGGVEPAGRVSHADFVAEAYCEGEIEPSFGDDVPVRCFDNYIYAAQMLRSIFINDPDNPEDPDDTSGDFIYAISTLGMSVSNVDSPDDLMTRVSF